MPKISGERPRPREIPRKATTIRPLCRCGHEDFDHPTTLANQDSLWRDGRVVIIHDGDGPCSVDKCRCGKFRKIAPVPKSKNSKSKG